MSLKVLGKFKHWAGHLSRHWNAVHDKVHSVHPIQEPAKHDDSSAGKPISTSTTSNGHKHSLSEDKAKRRQSGPPCKRFKPNHDHAPYIDESESEGDEGYSSLHETETKPNDRELFIMRKYMRRWWRTAGLPGHPNLCEEKAESPSVPWAKGITPRVEGRIKIINGKNTDSPE